MTSKHIYESTDGLVLKSLQGAVALNPSLCLDSASKSVYLLNNSSQKRVAVVAGGGAGHEPAHAGYIGTGMLTACVAGDVFASPSAKQILTMIKLAAFSGLNPTSTPRDVLIIINNYTGDRLNFGLAIEKARIAFPRVKVDSVIVADDISLLGQNSTSLVGPRGLAGNILVCKLLGALAESGATLESIKTFGESIVHHLKSVGVGLDPCHVPGRSTGGLARLQPNEYELGLGLHNEAGAAKRVLTSAEETLETMLVMLLEFVGEWRIDETVLFINNLGGMSQLEMGAAVYDIVSKLENEGYARPRRIFCSSYMTSLNAPGFSISILNVARIHEHMHKSGVPLDVYDLLDNSTTALAWVGSRLWHTPPPSHPIQEEHSVSPDLGESPNANPVDIIPNRRPRFPSSSMTRDAIYESCLSVLEVEHDLTQYDTLAGDGDCGETFSSGANAILKALEDGSLDVTGDVSFLVQNIANILEDVMGGTIGALFAIFFNALSSALSNAAEAPSLNPTAVLSHAIEIAIAVLERYTPARTGDRTIMDALHPFCDILKSHGHDGSQTSFMEAVRAARQGAESTRRMQARLGRAVYLNNQQENMPPDAGAWGVSAVLIGIMRGLGEEM